MSQFEVGDIIRFTSFPLHYAVYIGSDEIVHYNKRPNSGRVGKGKAGIIREKLQDYKARSILPAAWLVKVTYELSGERKSPSEIRERALRYVDKEDYNLLLRNCEHFATWCVYGKTVSGNVRAGVMGTGVLGFTAVGAGGGVAVGAGVGSVVPVAGTVVGGVVGAFIGTGVGFTAGILAAVLGLGITMLVYEVTDESEEFE